MSEKCELNSRTHKTTIAKVTSMWFSQFCQTENLDLVGVVAARPAVWSQMLIQAQYNRS